MARAVVGPTPRSTSRSASDAALRSIGAAGATPLPVAPAGAPPVAVEEEHLALVRDLHPLPVGQPAGEGHRLEVGVRRRTAGHGDEVGDPRPLRQVVDAGPAGARAGHLDDDLRRGHRGRSGQRAGGRRGRSGVAGRSAGQPVLDRGSRRTEEPPAAGRQQDDHADRRGERAG